MPSQGPLRPDSSRIGVKEIRLWSVVCLLQRPDVGRGRSASPCVCRRRSVGPPAPVLDTHWQCRRRLLPHGVLSLGVKKLSKRFAHAPNIYANTLKEHFDDGSFQSASPFGYVAWCKVLVRPVASGKIGLDTFEYALPRIVLFIAVFD